MTCEELRESYDTYALGVDAEPETSEIREHLRRACPNCVPGVGRSLSLASQMSLLAKPVDPPARLRTRIAAVVNPVMLEPTRARSGFGWSLVWGAAAAIFFVFALLMGVQARNLSALRRADAEQLQTAIAVISAPESHDVAFGANRARPVHGRVLLNHRRGVVLIASNLPQVEPGKSFELWLIPKAGAPIASGMFRASGDGTGLAVRAGEVPADVATVAVTVENEAGVAAPTTEPIIAAATEGV